MAKYHVNPKTGEPGRCRAIFSCPFGGVSGHWESREAARAGYEEEMRLTQDIEIIRSKIRHLPEPQRERIGYLLNGYDSEVSRNKGHQRVLAYPRLITEEFEQVQVELALDHNSPKARELAQAEADYLRLSENFKKQDQVLRGRLDTLLEEEGTWHDAHDEMILARARLKDVRRSLLENQSAQ